MPNGPSVWRNGRPNCAAVHMLVCMPHPPGWKLVRLSHTDWLSCQESAWSGTDGKIPWFDILSRDCTQAQDYVQYVFASWLELHRSSVVNSRMFSHYECDAMRQCQPCLLEGLIPERSHHYVLQNVFVLTMYARMTNPPMQMRRGQSAIVFEKRRLPCVLVNGRQIIPMQNHHQSSVVSGQWSFAVMSDQQWLRSSLSAYPQPPASIVLRILHWRFQSLFFWVHVGLRGWSVSRHSDSKFNVGRYYYFNLHYLHSRPLAGVNTILLSNVLLLVCAISMYNVGAKQSGHGIWTSLMQCHHTHPERRVESHLVICRHSHQALRPRLTGSFGDLRFITTVLVVVT